MLLLKYYSYDLKLAETFTVAANSRTFTEAIFVEINFNDKVGFGQASFPPYMKERRDDNLKFLSQLDLNQFNDPFLQNDIFNYLEKVSTEKIPAKAAIEMALYDLIGKLKNEPVHKILGLEIPNEIFTTYTIGIGADDYILRQLNRAKDFSILKIKLGSDIDYDKRIIDFIRNKSDQNIMVDFNQGINNAETALPIIEWLSKRKVLFVEQPLHVNNEQEYMRLKSESALDIYGDESIQTIEDIINKKDFFHGINIKLMKCGGINNALAFFTEAKKTGMKTMLGCMTESVVAINAAVQLAAAFDYIDLDGNVLITNDPFTGVSIAEGKIILNNEPGLGLKKII